MDLDRVAWQKSTYSNGVGGACVQVGGLDSGHRAVRDSKNPPGPALMITASEWVAFTAGVRAGEFD